MKITGNIGITRSSNDVYYIRLGCDASHVKFVEVMLTATQFAEAITGSHFDGVEMEVHNLYRVGKKRVREQRSVVCPLTTYKKEELRDWLLANCQEEGWFIDGYLNSQTSTKSVEGGTLLNYAVFKYVEVV